MKLTKTLLSLGCAGLFSLTTTAAHANVMTFDLDFGGSVGPNLSNPGYGTIVLTENGTGAAETVTVVETLTNAGGSGSNGEVYANTGAGDSLAFNISSAAGTLSYSILNPTSFVVGPTNTKNSPFGDFLQSIDCVDGKTANVQCHGGDAANPNVSSGLTFTVSGTNGVTIADFLAQPASGAFFASDLFIGNAGTGSGNTGVVAAGNGTMTVVTTPEPSSLLLLGTGILGVAGTLRRRVLSAR